MNRSFSNSCAKVDLFFGKASFLEVVRRYFLKNVVVYENALAPIAAGILF